MGVSDRLRIIERASWSYVALKSSHQRPATVSREG